jgi:hypothetical protein
MDKALKDKLMHYKVSVLRFLLLLATTDSFSLELTEISQSTGTAEEDLKGPISVLRRTKNKGKPLIKVSGKDEKGRYLWRINPEAVDKKELADFLTNEILGKDGLSFSKSN